MTTPATTTGVVSLDAARDAVGGMLAALGVPTRPTWSVATDAVLTVLLQASGTRVAVPAFEVCDQCDAFRPIVLPDGHPESLTAELTREEEDYLGWLADQLWPEVADREMADAARTNAFGDESADDPQMGGA